jgi:uncharacterized glyoxalase superfamily protein PhnB
MSDPFEVLRMPLEPVAPDPVFSQRLRARIERALVLPKGVIVSDIDLDLDEMDLDTDLEPDLDTDLDTDLAPERTGSVVTPYLAIAGASQAIEWYSEALDARLRSEPIVMPDGRIGHAEIEIGGALIMLADEFPEIGHSAPSPGLGVPVTLHLSVIDVDPLIERAVSAGANLESPARDYEYGRNATIRDPFGHRWIISGQRAATSDPHSESRK